MEKEHYGALSAGIMLIGIGLIFLLPGVDFWPWILVVIGLAGLPASLAAKRGWLGWQGVFWLAGLAVLFWSGYFWPGILILIGLSILLGALYQSASRPAKKPLPSSAPFAEPPDTREQGTPFEPEESSQPSEGETRKL